MKSFRALARYMSPYWLPALLAPLLMAMEVTMDLSQPRLLQKIVDVGVARHDLHLVVHTGLLMVGVALVGLVGGVGCTIFATIAALKFGADIRGELFRKVQRLSCANLDHLETGHLITRLTNDVDQVQDAAAMFLRILVRAPLLVLGSLIMAVVTCPKLSLLIVALCPLLIATFLVIVGRAQTLFRAVQERLDRVNVVLQENLSGVRVVKAFVRAERESARFGQANEDLMGTTVRASSLVASSQPVMMLLMNLGVVGVVWWGGGLMRGGQVHLGQILAFINYLTQMLGSLMMVAMLLMQVARADASAARILEVLNAVPAVQDPEYGGMEVWGYGGMGDGAPAAAPLELPYSGPPTPPHSHTPTLPTRVEFADVTFSYDGTGSEPVLRDVSFTAEPGQTVAILGATGSGKSTLVHLVARLYDVTGGSIRVDGVDVRRMRQDGLRSLVGMVPQETVLFSGSIRENIRFGRPAATDAEVEEAARLAQAHDFIQSLPGAYEATLGQRGTNLSGGQKQRLAIARALACRPSILILDDCTSAVDGSTEAAILQGLNTWSHRCTRLIVAQRLGAVMAADKILVLEDGAIAASGTHEELLRTSPIYREIARSQMDGIEVSHD